MQLKKKKMEKGKKSTVNLGQIKITNKTKKGVNEKAWGRQSSENSPSGTVNYQL